jgi:hypothetical protein
MHYPAWPGMVIDNRSRDQYLEWSSVERFRKQSLPKTNGARSAGWAPFAMTLQGF